MKHDQAQDLDVTADTMEAVEIIAEQLARGEQIDLEAVCAQYPSSATRIRRLVPILLAVNELADEQRAGPDDDIEPHPIPQILGGFRIIRQLGRGGMGVVYLAEQLGLERHVAIKVLPFAALLDQRQLERFKNEARAAAMLKHPNIVSVLSVGAEQGINYYVMDYVEGLSLAEIIAQTREHARPPENVERESPKPVGKVSIPDTSPIAELTTNHETQRHSFYRAAARIGREAARALHYAHTEGVIHRDIKPSNLLIGRDGKLHITDFGLARVQSDPGLTLTGDVIGTLRYMSPEQLDGSSLVDHRTDICSLGLTLYELVAGQPAYPAQGRHELISQVKTHTPLAPSSICRQIPRDLETIILKAIDRDPTARFPTAEAMAEDLERFLHNRPITARRVGSFERARRWAARNQITSLLLATVALLLLLLSVGSLITANRLREDNRRQHLSLYARDMRLCQLSVANGDHTGAEQILSRWIPDEPTEDLRGFEWYHLWQQCHNDSVSRTIVYLLATHDVAFLPTGESLAVGWMNPKIDFWSLDTQQDHPAQRLSSDDSQAVISRLLCVPQQNTLVSAATNGVIEFWDTESGERTARVQCDGPPGRYWVRALSVSPDFQELAVAVDHGADHTVHVWDRKRQQWSKPLEGYRGRCAIAFVANNQLAIATENSPVLEVRETKTWQLLRELDLQADGAGVLLASPDGAKLAVGVHRRYGDQIRGSVEVWQIGTWQKTHGFPIHQHRMHALAFSPDGNRLAAGSDDSGLSIIDLRSSHVVHIPNAHAGTVRGLAFSPSGRKLASAGRDGKVQLWEVDLLSRADSTLSVLDAAHGHIKTVGFLDEGRTACASDSNGDVFLWDGVTGRTTTRFQVDLDGANQTQLVISPDRQWVAVTRGHWPPQALPGRVAVFHADTGALYRSYDAPAGIVYSMSAFSPDAQYLAVCCKNHLMLFDLEADRVSADWEFATWVKSASFSPNGQILACSDSGGRVHVYGMPERQRLTSFQADRQACECVAFSPNGRLLAAVGGEKRVNLFATSGFQRMDREFQLCPSFLVSVRFSPDGQRIVTAAMDGDVRLWHTETGEELLRIPIPRRGFGHTEFSPDGSSLVATAGEDARVFRILGRDSLARMSVTQINDLMCRNVTSVETIE